ncbi:16832_t:CDS:2, partial [Racocetra fulgida]
TLTESDERLKEFGLGGLCNLCLEKRNKEHIINNDGVPLIIQCLYDKNEEIILSAITTLMFLLTDREENEVNTALISPNLEIDIQARVTCLTTIGGNVSHEFFWEVPSFRSQVLKETFVEKYGTQPLFRIEQVVIKIANSKKYNKENGVGVLDKDLLLWTSCLQGIVMDTVVMYSNQPSSLVAKKYSLSDI